MVEVQRPKFAQKGISRIFRGAFVVATDFERFFILFNSLPLFWVSTPIEHTGQIDNIPNQKFLT